MNKVQKLVCDDGYVLCSESQENDRNKVKLQVDNGNFIQLYTMINGFQWSGCPMNKDLAKQAIEVLQNYLADE